ncbi:hypothetical protein [Dactylosporangium sp. NPDC005555]
MRGVQPVVAVDVVAEPASAGALGDVCGFVEDQVQIRAPELPGGLRRLG